MKPADLGAERAKGIIQRDLKLSEEEAYLALQRQSRNRGKSMKEIAESILLNEEIRAVPENPASLPSSVPSSLSIKDQKKAR